MLHKKDKKVSPKRPRTVLILGWLLIIQSLMMFALSVYHFALNQGPQLLFLWLSRQAYFEGHSLSFVNFINQLVLNATSQRLISALIESAALFLLTILAASAAVGFFRLWKIAWTQAIFVEGVALLIALILYFSEKPRHIYLLMVSGVFMVLYLNYANLQSFFISREPLEPETDYEYEN